MTTDVLAILILSLIALGGYVVFLLVQRRAAKNSLIVTVRPGKRHDEAPIYDSMAYRETKDAMRRLRADLDRFEDAVDRISAKGSNSAEWEMDEVYRENIPLMHAALVDARNTAATVFALVKKTIPTDKMEVNIIGSSHHAPAGAAKVSIEIGVLSGLLRTIDEVNPCIAWFYYSFTHPDEVTQSGEASVHVKQIISYLDYAVHQMLRIEQALADHPEG